MAVFTFYFFNRDQFGIQREIVKAIRNDLLLLTSTLAHIEEPM